MTQRKNKMRITMNIELDPAIDTPEERERIRKFFHELHSRIHEAWQNKKGLIGIQFTADSVHIIYAKTGKTDSLKMDSSQKDMVV